MFFFFFFLQFLVKGGEDLRLDERIEQLFGIMNEVRGGYSEGRGTVLCGIVMRVIVLPVFYTAY